MDGGTARQRWWEGAGLAWRATPVCTLLDRLGTRREPFPVRAALELGAAVLETLAVGHRRPDDEGGPVVHGRLSAADVWLSPTGEVLVSPSIRGSAEAAGPPPPDPGDGEGPVPADDVHAAAALVVTLLTGRREPRAGVGPAGPVLQDQAIEAALDLVRGRVGCSLPARTLVALLRVSLSRSPDDRPDATALADTLRDLASLQRGEGLATFAARMRVVAASEIPTVHQGVEVGVRPAAQPPVPAPWVRTALVGSGAASLGLCAVVMGGVAWRLGGADAVRDLLCVVTGTETCASP